MDGWMVGWGMDGWVGGWMDDLGGWVGDGWMGNGRMGTLCVKI